MSLESLKRKAIAFSDLLTEKLILIFFEKCIQLYKYTIPPVLFCFILNPKGKLFTLEASVNKTVVCLFLSCNWVIIYKFCMGEKFPEQLKTNASGLRKEKGDHFF